MKSALYWYQRQYRLQEARHINSHPVTTGHDRNQSHTPWRTPNFNLARAAPWGCRSIRVSPVVTITRRLSHQPSLVKILVERQVVTIELGEPGMIVHRRFIASRGLHEVTRLTCRAMPAFGFTPFSWHLRLPRQPIRRKPQADPRTVGGH